MANRYWVGGTGVWDATNTTPWAQASGGGGGFSVPTSADVVFFDSVSNPHTITLAYSPILQSLRFDTFRGTFNANNKTISLNSGPTGFAANGSMTMLGSPSINVIAVATSSIQYILTNCTFNNININSFNGQRNVTGTGFTINSLTCNPNISVGTLGLGNGTINNWNINRPITISGGTITVTNPTKLLDGLSFIGTRMNINPVTFYAGKNSTFNNGTEKGIALSDGLFNYDTPKQKIIVLESGTSWTVPDDFTLVNTIHLFGGGGGGGKSPVGGSGIATGGGGGGYTRVNNLNLTPRSTITYSIGLGGAANTNGGNTTFSTYSANGGSTGLTAPQNTNTAGGAGGIGLTYNGGSGGSATGVAVIGGTGGGGAGGPYGNGTDGATRITSGTGSGGGSNGGGTAAADIIGGVSLWPNQTAGGNARYGNGGNGGNALGNPSLFIGSGINGGNGVDVNSVTGGGGGGGSADSNGADLYGTVSGNGGLYGGGGAGSISDVPAGLGADGAVIIVYTANQILKHRLANTGTLQTNTYFDETQIGTGSMYFNGSSFLTTSNNSNLAFGTNDFTIEYLLYPTNIQPVVAAQLSSGGSASATSWQVGINSGLGTMSFAYNGGASVNGTTVLQTNRWYHVAFTRNSGTLRVFLNGIQEASVTASNNYSEDFIKIGNSRVPGNFFSGGHLSNIRIVNGTALYTDNFVPQIIPVTNVSNTSLLFPTYTYNVFADYSNNRIAMVNTGVTSNTLSPFTTTTPKFTTKNVISQLDERNKVVFITSGTTFTIPEDFLSFISVECIGAGGGQAGNGSAGNGGAGGGAYSKSTAVTGLVSGATAYVSIGLGGDSTGTSGGNTWFNAVTNSAPTLTSQGALAIGGGGCSAGGGTFGAGGAAGSGVGTIKFTGGNGGTGSSGGSAGSGGAAGPGGDGGNGGFAFAFRPAGGGGAAGLSGAGGTAPTFGTTGGTGGDGGLVEGGDSTSSGNAGRLYTATNGNIAGPGSGAGGGGAAGGVAGGLYGGGGKTGGNGLIVFTYKSSPMSISNTGIISVSSQFDESYVIE